MTYGADNFAKSFFAGSPVDSRFLSCNYQRFLPKTALDSRTVSFELARFESPSIYVIQDAVLEVRFAIVKSDNQTLPGKEDLVAPVNNVLHSLFESCRMFINETEITSSASSYPYKAYISNCLTYSTIVKGSQLQSQGYYADTAVHFDALENNSGFMSRNALFRQGFVKTNEYREDGATFFGRLFHDLVTCETGIPPSTKVRIDLQRSSDEFVLMKKPTDNEKYKVKFKKISLYIPIGHLAEGVYHEFNSLLTKTIDNKPVVIPYRKIEIFPVTIPRNSAVYHSQLLFSDDMPVRVVIVFLESSRKTGEYSTNPFYFKRKWTVKKLQTEEASQNESSDETIALKRRLAEIEQLNRELISRLEKGKGPKRGKSTRGRATRSSQPFPAPSTSQGKYVEFYEDTGSVTSGNSTTDSFRDVGDDTKDVWLKKVNLILNGAPVDQLEGVFLFWYSVIL